jgi:hypothetical protein
MHVRYRRQRNNRLQNARRTRLAARGSAQLRQHHLQVIDVDQPGGELGIARRQLHFRGGTLRVVHCTLRDDQRAERTDVLRQIVGLARHEPGFIGVRRDPPSHYPESDRRCSRLDLRLRSAVHTGRLQSMPSTSIERCDAVSVSVPSTACGQMNRPFSSRLA